MVLAAPSTAVVGVDDRLLDDVLEPLPDFFFLFLSPGEINCRGDLSVGLSVTQTPVYIHGFSGTSQSNKCC